MKEIKRILVATDFSDNANNAFHYALWFASKCKAEICLLHIIYPQLELADIPVMSANVTTQRVEVAEAVMKDLIERYAPDFKPEILPEVKTEVAVGIPATLISEMALKNKADLIIMGMKGKHNLLDRNIGNVIFTTIDFAVCPILVIPENINLLRIETVAYATDLTASDPFNIWETGKLLKPFNPILRIVHIQQKAEENKAIEMEELKAFFKGNPPSIQITYHNLINKNVTPELDDFIKAWDVDLLIMNRPNRSIIERIFHSSLTKKTALHTKIPFLILK